MRSRLSAVFSWTLGAAALSALAFACSSSEGGGLDDPGPGPGTGSAASDGGSDAWRAPDVGPPVDAGDPGKVDVHFAIHADKNVKAISPYIYGVNDGAQAAATHATLVRSGGNRLTAFNWENNASNAGSDYQFENDDYMCGNGFCKPNSDAVGAYLLASIDQAKAANAAMLLTVPIVDYVAADKSPAGDVRNAGSNYLSTRFKQNKPVKGSAFSLTPDPNDGFVYEDEMVNFVHVKEPGATLWFLLDNEPDLWSNTHAEIHPNAVTYAELAKRNIDYAKAIKAVMPDAPVYGPVSYGWNGYVNLQNAPDSQANGDFVEWWLDQMKAAEAANGGKRVVDGLDLHWYPEATGGGARITDNGTGAAEVAAREQAPRSLWDATYTETSWITQSSTNGPINLIPRMMDKIAKHYPGTKLSFTEWNYGAGNDISGAIASADVLGIFGREGVTMASLWPMSEETFTYAAFKIFRSYDGQAKAFGDTSVLASTDDVPNSSVYASIDASDPSRCVIVAINKATAAKTAGIQVFHPTTYTKANVYTLTAAGGAKVVPGAALTAVATNAFRYPMPPQSVTVLELVK